MRRPPGTLFVLGGRRIVVPALRRTVGIRATGEYQQ